MRIVLSVLLTMSLLAGTYVYSSFTKGLIAPASAIQVELDDSRWQIEITRTFDCQGDSIGEIAAIVVQFKGEDIFLRQTDVLAHEPIQIELINVEQGLNEVYVEANVAFDDEMDAEQEHRPQALRIIVLRGNSLVADQSFWISEGETSIFESVEFSAPTASTTADHHEHAGAL